VDGREETVVGAVAAGGLVMRAISVEAGEEQVHGAHPLAALGIENEIRVHGDEEAALLRQSDDVPDVAPHHRLPPGQAETLHAEARETVEKRLDAGERQIRGVEKRRVAVAAPQIAAIGDGERGRDGTRRAVYVPGQKALAEGESHRNPSVNHGRHRRRRAPAARRCRSRPSTRARRSGWTRA